MKKLIAVLCAIFLLAGMGNIAFATSGPAGNATIEGYNSQTVPVTAAYQEATPGELYHVNVVWAGLSFTYHAKSNGEWDPKTHKYSDSKDAYWTASDDGGVDANLNIDGQKAGVFTITNNSAYEAGSNGTVYVSFTFNEGSSVEETLGDQFDMRFATNTSFTSQYRLNNLRLVLPGPSGPEQAGGTLKVYVLPKTYNEVNSFDNNLPLGNIVVTISAYSSSGDPGIPEGPGIESVQPTPVQTEVAAPTPEAGEMAANG